MNKHTTLATLAAFIGNTEATYLGELFKAKDESYRQTWLAVCSAPDGIHDIHKHYFEDRYWTKSEAVVQCTNYCNDVYGQTMQNCSAIHVDEAKKETKAKTPDVEVKFEVANPPNNTIAANATSPKYGDTWLAVCSAPDGLHDIHKHYFESEYWSHDEAVVQCTNYCNDVYG